MATFYLDSRAFNVTSAQWLDQITKKQEMLLKIRQKWLNDQ